jgi:hypothetical protein
LLDKLACGVFIVLEAMHSSYFYIMLVSGLSSTFRQRMRTSTALADAGETTWNFPQSSLTYSVGIVGIVHACSQTMQDVPATYRSSSQSKSSTYISL